MSVPKRLAVRLPDADTTVIAECSTTITDRLKLRIGVGEDDDLPAAFESIVVDASVKMYRRIYYEGISSEGAADITTSFVDDILAEYAEEIQAYLDGQANSGSGSREVHFF